MVRAVWGRDRELALVASALDEVPSGLVAVVLTGEDGMGKTAVWEAALSLAEDRAYRVLSARPVESEATITFASVADLLRDAVDEVLPVLPAPQRSALEGALLHTDVAGSPDPRGVAFAFYNSIVALARSCPLIVGLDDVQWLDPASARVLSFALRRLDDVPVGIVATSRSAPDRSDPIPFGLDEDRLDERLHLISIGPLGPDVIRRILRARLDVRFPRWALEQLYEASGGDPLLALELARALMRRGIDPVPGRPLPIPQRLADLVAERLVDLPDAVRWMLLLVAASPRPMLPSISKALGAHADLDEAVETALGADVIEVFDDRVRFTNPLLGTALYAGSAPAERRRAHGLLAQTASEPEERARHLALAADGPDEDVARLLEDAARRTRSHGAPDGAAQLAELARALTPVDDAEARVRRTSDAGRYAFESAHIERAEELLQEAVASASTGPMRAEALLYLSRVHYHRRDTPSASALAEQALREARADPSLQASINLELAAAAELSGDRRSAMTRARRAVQLAERSGDRTTTAEALAVLALYRFESGRGIPSDLIERAKSLQGRGLPVRPLRSPTFNEACMLMWSDDLVGARDRFRRLEARARDTGDEGSLAILLFMLSQIDSWAGDWDGAGRRADESRAVAEWTGQRIYLGFALYASALVAALRGDTDRARVLGTESLHIAEQVGSVRSEEFARSVLGFMELSRGDANMAHGWLSVLLGYVDDVGGVDPGTLRYVPDEVEALIALDEVDQAEALLLPFEARAKALGRTWALGSAARCRGLAWATRREFEHAIGAFDRAIEHQRSLGQPLELGRTYMARGSVLRRAKKWAPARDSLNRALRVFEGLGAAIWSERTRSELARIGGRTPSPSALTETETRIAQLVATGLTNREVAARLFLSASTVESSLRRTYRKLGVRSRAELSHRLSVASTANDA